MPYLIPEGAPNAEAINIGSSAASAVSTAPTPISATAAGIFGLIGAGAGTFANSYLDALGKKAAGVNVVAQTPSTGVVDSSKQTNLAAAASSPFSLSNPLVVGGLAAVAALALILVFRRD